MPTALDYKRRRRLGLIFGIILTGIGLYQFSNIWISKSDLIRIKGTLSNARTNVSMVFSKSSRYTKTETTSRKSELIFTLKEYDQEYYLVENIGEHYIDDDHEAILKGLREADSISVWIKKSEGHVWRPQIFQIDNDQATLLKFEHLHIKDDLVTALLIVIGVFFIIICSVALIRDKHRSTRRQNPMQIELENLPIFRNWE